MKQGVLVIMMWCLLLPSLVCAMPSCPLETDKTEQIPCHEMADVEMPLESSVVPMIALDCLDLELYQVCFTLEFELSQGSDHIDHEALVTANPFSLQIQRLRDIRGSPRIIAHALPPFSVILSTQRYRI